jgi:hypothetical protein
MTDPSASAHTGAVLVYAIHRTHAWWRHVADHLGFERSVVLTDRRGEGDRWVTDAFYAAVRRNLRDGATHSALLSEAEVADVIRRCRVLRSQPRRRAIAMALSMAEAMDEVLVDLRPDFVVSFPIDNYVQDVLARRARARGATYFELTASALPDMCMLMHRGRLIGAAEAPAPEVVESKVRQIADPLFTPAYVQNAKAFTPTRFLKVLTYFQIRSVFFRLYSLLRRDLLNTHYLDAQTTLLHKPKLGDIRILGMFDQDWEARLDSHPRERRVLFGLQLFPEAAIDYWIDDPRLLDHEDMLVEAARKLTEAGFQILVKDHPLQFGFRQVELIERLRALQNVVLVPYEVSGNRMLEVCGVSLTATGTLGLQSALMGSRSVTGEAYYANPEDFILLRTWDDLSDLATLVEDVPPPAALQDRQKRIVTQLLRGSFTADFFSFRGFDPAQPSAGTTELGRALGERLRRLGPDHEAWHERNLPADGGGHLGSPLN